MADARAGTKRPRVQPSAIVNKMKRSQVYNKLRTDKKRTQDKARKDRKLASQQLGAAAPPRQIPRTIDNTREVEESYVSPEDEEVLADEAEDEFADYFAGTRDPKIMITTRPHPSAKMFPLIAEILGIIPNAFYYKRMGYPLKKICEWAEKRGFTHLIVLNEKAKTPNAMIVSHLGTGPTAYFKLSSSRLGKDIANHGVATRHVPELILRHFTTRLGRRTGRILGSLFPHRPQFEGRRVCTFHNQRDFIFFRQHRYMFNDAGTGVKLQELGPRFTLKLKWMLAGTFDTKMGEYEFFHKRHEMETSRRRFLL